MVSVAVRLVPVMSSAVTVVFVAVRLVSVVSSVV